MPLKLYRPYPYYLKGKGPTEVGVGGREETGRHLTDRERFVRWLGSRSPAPGVIASRWAGGMFDAAVTAFGWSPGRRRHKDIRGWACIKAGRNKWLIFLDRSRPLFDDQIKMRGENECFRDQ
ncbi:hypothetical protein SUGI_1498800 [Cryptomeria japonica]|uniref:Uncharacterized protein n=1 Tax=Cryptomeria japonica TaxID=3369 RepID=A0AAD3RRR9_CRYJA|nr:hypothetical protein SUGI_1498800 [Cryptomeria japonica]